MLDGETLRLLLSCVIIHLVLYVFFFRELLCLLSCRVVHLLCLMLNHAHFPLHTLILNIWLTHFHILLSTSQKQKHSLLPSSLMCTALFRPQLFLIRKHCGVYTDTDYSNNAPHRRKGRFGECSSTFSHTALSSPAVSSQSEGRDLICQMQSSNALATDSP